MRYPLLILSVWIFCAGTTEAGEDSVRLGALDVTVWSQRTEANAKQPVVIFSHGFHGCRFLMEAFSADGDLVWSLRIIAMRLAMVVKAVGSAALRFRFGTRGSGTKVPIETAQMISAVWLAPLEPTIAFAQERICLPFALAGHSLGGYTVLGLAVRGQAGNSLGSRQSGPGLLHRARTANSSNDWGWSS